jgi:GT2 family glycosyltransferase
MSGGGLTVSVVIVSHARPQALQRCLLAVSQLLYDPFEVVVVADPAGCAALRALPQAAHVKMVAFEPANISAARNAGIIAAAGEVIAFIDDDAVPEPTWLRYLVAPFSRPEVMAAAGFVRARNGISWQSRAQWVDRSGHSKGLQVDPVRTTVLTPTPDRAIRTEGTNMAMRRDCLADLGGFDPRFKFFLDETDLNLRLAARGLATAIVPCAEVHHGFAASGRRRADRVPRDLHEIGASWAIFLAKHCAAGQREAVWQQVQDEQRHRLLNHLVGGGLEPGDVRRLLRGLRRGFREGAGRQARAMTPLPHPSEAFQPFPATGKARPVVISGRVWSRASLRASARQEVAGGANVTLMRFSPTALFHRVAYHRDGYWEHTGGLFGKSDRSQEVFLLRLFSHRVRHETERIGRVRGLNCKNRDNPRDNPENVKI